MHDAYLAGLIDGEGSIMLLGQGKGRCRRPVVSLSMKDHEAPLGIQAAFGGFTSRKPNGMLEWRLNGIPALNLLDRLRPFLVTKRKRSAADLLCGSLTLRTPTRTGSNGSKVIRVEALFAELRKINAKRDAGVSWPRKRNPRDPDFHYLAGILDGEGHIREDRRVEVWSTDPELLGWLSSHFGGSVLNGRPESANRRRTWRWLASSRAWGVEVAGHMLLPRKASRLRP